MNVNFQANIVRKSELRQTAGKKSVINIGLAVNTYTRDDKGEWVEGDSYFMNASAFGYLATHIDASINVGDPVIGSGALKKKRDWTDKNGVEHTNDVEILLDSLGVDLNRRDVQVIKPENTGNGNSTTRTRTSTTTKTATKSSAPKNDDVLDEFGGFDDDFDNDEDDPFKDM